MMDLKEVKKEKNSKDEDEDDDPLLKAVEKLGRGSALLWMIFFFTIFPTIFSGMHSNTYIFVAEIPTHWCEIEELSFANWTIDEIRNVSSIDSCSKYDYNYTLFAEIGFPEALKYVRSHEFPKSIPCTEYHYENDVERYSMVQEWNLVCNKAPERATTHMALSLGKLMGAGFFGVIGDKYGRKLVYTLGIILFVVSGPSSSYIPCYWGFVFFRLITGISFSAIQFSSFTTLTEMASSTHRQWMAIAYNCGFAIGPIVVAGISYLAKEWRQVQIATSMPALILLLFIWLMPESPRWLISQGRRQEARNILQRYLKKKIGQDRRNSSYIDAHKSEIGGAKSGVPYGNHTKGLKIIFGSRELLIRALIAYFTWMSASLTYYALALNVDNFAVDYYLYEVLLGLTEIPSYLVPSALLMVMGRKTASSFLYVLSGLLLLSILSISRSETVALLAASLVGRFSLSSAYAISILYTSELFPTTARNTAVGTSSSMAHVGSIIAPYCVDTLGSLAWWAPSTLCGSLALFAGTICLLLPETRNRPLADTSEQELAEGRGRVSFGQCCS